MFTHNDLSIRLVESNDLPYLIDLRSDPDVWKNLGNIKMLSMAFQEKWLRLLTENATREYYILSHNKYKIGMVRTDEIDYINRSIRVGGDIHKDHRGKGFGRGMMELIKKYCFDYLNMRRMWLMVLETNTIARKLYRSIGFVEEGRHRKAIYRNGKYIDYILMGLLKEELDG